MVNASLIIIGAIIIIGVFIGTQIMITPQQKEQIALLDSVCGSVFGSLGKSFSSDVANKCQEISIYRQLLTASPFLYIIGIILLIVGLVINGNNRVEKEVSKKATLHHKKNLYYK